MNKKKKGFTLAEILISAFILGIVITLLTNIMKKTDAEGRIDEIHFLSVYKNVHLILKTFVLRNANENFDYQTACPKDPENPEKSEVRNTCLRDLVSSRMSTIRKMESADMGKFSSRFKILADAQGFIAMGGSYIVFEHANDTCATTQEVMSQSATKDKYCWIIYIDTNGDGYPNKIGLDQFAVPLYKNGLMPPSMNAAKPDARNNINENYPPPKD